MTVTKLADSDDQKEHFAVTRTKSSSSVSQDQIPITTGSKINKSARHAQISP